MVSSSKSLPGSSRIAMDRDSVGQLPVHRLQAFGR